MAMKFNRSFNINRVVSRLVYTILALYVGGIIMSVFGDVMNGTCSGFYQGLSLIGWTVGAGTAGTTGCPATNTNTITATADGGVLSVVGIIAVAGVVMEFIKFR